MKTLPIYDDEPLPCDRCDGTGKVTVTNNPWYPKQRNYIEWISEECPECHGTGVDPEEQP